MYYSTIIGGDVAIVTKGGLGRSEFLDPPLFDAIHFRYERTSQEAMYYSSVIRVILRSIHGMLIVVDMLGCEQMILWYGFFFARDCGMALTIM
jgi:hypothetical protein